MPQKRGLRALSLTQPWATLVSIGAKTIETRSWKTDYRGPLAIHASKAFPAWAQELCFANSRFVEALRTVKIATPEDLSLLPRGFILGVTTLVDCIRTSSEQRPRIGSAEYEFGDYSNGRWMWMLGEAIAFPTPIPCGGLLGVWVVDADITAQCRDQYRLATRPTAAVPAEAIALIERYHSAYAAAGGTVDDDHRMHYVDGQYVIDDEVPGGTPLTYSADVVEAMIGALERKASGERPRFACGGSDINPYAGLGRS